MTGNRLVEGLSEVVGSALGGVPVEVPTLRRLSSGASRESWLVEITTASGRALRLVAQLCPERMSGSNLSPTVEARLLQAAGAAGAPAPAVVASGDAGGPFGVPYLVTEWIDGETLPSRLFRDDRYRVGLPRLNAQCAAALARVHALPVEPWGLPARDPLEQYRTDLDASGQAHPTLEWAYRWLVGNRPPPHTETVLHGDFRLGNLMVDEQGLRAVLDWELAHVGDPYEDLAWPLVRAWRFDRLRPPGTFPDRRAWLAAYAEACGRAVDSDVVRWWEVAGTFKWAVICITQWRRHFDGSTRSVELAAIGRRVAENEYDLLRLIP